MECGNNTKGKKKLCGYCRDYFKRVNKSQRDTLKSDKLFKRLVEFHKVLVKENTSKRIILKFWRTFKPILPNHYKRLLTSKGY